MTVEGLTVGAKSKTQGNTLLVLYFSKIEYVKFQ